MHCFKVLFIAVILRGLNVNQIKANSTFPENASANNIDHSPTCKKPTTGCKTDNNEIKLVFSDPLMNITESLNQNDHPCCNFKRDNSFFLIDAHCVYKNKCSFNVSSPDSSSKLLNGSLLNITSKCPVTQVLDLCYPKNFKIAPLVLGDGFDDSFISLNISWDVETDCQDKADITIVPNSTDVKHCLYQPPSKLGHHLTENNIQMPISSSDIEGFALLPGCSYNVSILEYCSTIYTVPEYVQKDDKILADCVKFNSTSTPKILDIKMISNNDYLVIWDTEETKDNRTIITDIVFTYTLKDFGEIPINNYTNNMRNHTSVIAINMEERKMYNITGKFVNIYGCATKVYFPYNATLELPTEKSGLGGIVGGIIGGAVIVFFLASFFVFKSKMKKITQKLYKHKGLTGEDVENHEAPLMSLGSSHIYMIPNVNYIPLENVERIFGDLELSRGNVILKEVIGSGAFGKVYAAKAKGIEGIDDYRMVAVKTVGEEEPLTSDVKNDFIAEIGIFRSIGSHPNIVKLLACCTSEIPYMMIMELVPCGDLKKYLLDLRKQWMRLNKKKQQVFFGNDEDGPEPSSPGFSKALPKSPYLFPSTSECSVTPITPLMADFEHALDRVLDPDELQHFAFQIAKGMAHLEKIPITHRDLAARNILINQSKILKISDFGLSRTGPYINHKSKRLPLRWMAIEAIIEQKYDSKSDVWSFGVVLWEIGTLGAFPYEKIPDSYLQQFLQLGNRLQRPEICSGELYALMQRCWKANPEDRPTFQELVGQLDVKKQKVYVDFSQLNPTYVFPPSEINQIENPVQIIELPNCT